MKRLTKIALAAGVLAVATTAIAQPKPENFVKQRQSALALIGWYFGPLGAVAKGEAPLNTKHETLTRPFYRLRSYSNQPVV